MCLCVHIRTYVSKHKHMHWTTHICICTGVYKATHYACISGLLQIVIGLGQNVIQYFPGKLQMSPAVFVVLPMSILRAPDVTMF